MKNLHSTAGVSRNLLWRSWINGNSSNIIASCFALSRRYYRHTRVDSNAFPFFQPSSIQHPFKNWQDLRKHKLTASTFSSAIGFWRRRRVQLWLEKIGAIEPFTCDMSTCWNNIKEEEALKSYILATGNSVSLTDFQVYKKINPEDYYWLAASPDGLVVESHSDGSPSTGVLEIKCPYFDGEKTKAFPWKRIPVHYIPQAQGLMEILDLDWMDMYVWTLRGSSLFRLHRDTQYWDLLKIALSDFWWKHVHPAREVYQNSKISNPLVQLQSFVPAKRHDLHRDLVWESKRISNSSELRRLEMKVDIRNFHKKLAKETCLRY